LTSQWKKIVLVNGGAFQNIKADFPVYANDISIDREVQSAFLQASKQVLTPFFRNSAVY